MELGKRGIPPMANRIGQEVITTEGYVARIVEYTSAKKMVIEFQDEYKYRMPTTYNNFIKGRLRNPYHRRLYGVGYVGVDSKGIRIKVDDYKREYDLWNDMLKKCYETKNSKRIVAESWHCFANFLRDLPSLYGYGQWVAGNDVYLDVKQFYLEFAPNNTQMIYSFETCRFALIKNKPKKRRPIVAISKYKSKHGKGQIPCKIHFDDINDAVSRIEFIGDNERTKRNVIEKCLNGTHGCKSIYGFMWEYDDNN